MPAAYSDLANDLSRAISGEVRFDPYSRALYSTDASAYQIEPLGVVLPRTADDVQAAIEIAAKHNAPILPRGGGSSLAGQAVGRAVVLDFSKYMRRIIEIDPEARTVQAEPGVVCDALNAALKPHGLMFGAEPASSNRATVGGIIANNATGAHSVMYGMTIDHLLAARIFLADGSERQLAEADSIADPFSQRVADLVAQYTPAILDRFPKTWRRASGYALNYLLTPAYTATRPANWYSTDSYPPAGKFNLAKILAGSEGTLAVMTEATLNLVPRPKLTGLCVVHFDSLAAACDATPAILDCKPAAVELIDRMMIDLTRSVPGYAPKLTFIDGNPAAILVVEFYGDSESHLLSQIESLEAHLRSPGLAQKFVRALTAQQQANVWGVRKVGLGLLASMKSEAKPIAFMEDVAVPVERLGAWVRAAERLFMERGIKASYYAHASAGCLHIRPILDLKFRRDIAIMKELSDRVLEIIIDMGGAFSGEHGDGLSRSIWNGRLFGAELYEAFCELKRLFDPHNRLNPGKVVDGPEMDHDLRYNEDYETISLATHLSFAEYSRGFAAAVEQCNGQGVCRKADGTMCPSYHATLEEEHSTRGRANALRLALSGKLPPAELTSERMHAVLDLCLECKACKTECPSGVDMAKIKYEWLAQYQAVHGVPLRSRLFANIHSISQLGHLTAPLANIALKLPPTRWLNEKLLGISSRRTLPPFAPQTFRQWFAGRGNQPSQIGNQQSVVLFTDTYTNYNHPSIGKAAVRVLEAAGYNVLLADHGCCGRPMISKGLLDEAKDAAEKMVSVLYPLAAQGSPIIGLEPSCLLSFRDEYLDLLPDDPRVKVLAKQAVMIEEFLSVAASRGELNIRWKGDKRKVLVHGHCYQKSLTGTDPVLAMLRLPGWDVSEINSGCCGMAGAFGYEAEHYDISQTIGEDRLFPAVRAASHETLIAAAGMSCRHQIENGTGRAARHPIEVLAEAVP